MGLLRNIRYLLRAAQIDNFVYVLHYRLTVLILVVFSFIITCRLVLGDSFTCLSDAEVPSDFLQTLCYAQTPFLVPSAFLNPKESLYPGVSAHKPSDGDPLLFQSYYPWVNLFFLLLAVIFYLPHFAWKTYERRVMARVTSDIDRPLMGEISKENAINEIVKFLKSMRSKSAMYATVYLFTEMVNFVVDVLLTVWLLSFFRINEKIKNAVGFKTETWEDFFSYYFPPAGKCKIYLYASKGNIKFYDALCLMPLNHMYGYMFLFLYAWFIMLGLVSGTIIVYRVLVLSIPQLRLKLLRSLLLGVDHNLLLRLAKQYSFGDLIVLNFMKKNLLPHDYSKLVLSVLDKEHIGE